MSQETAADSVRLSRAGDVFHYRWAARRCLKLLDTKSNLIRLVVEGSSKIEEKLEGEHVIDVAEYYAVKNLDREEVVYYQLKHTIQCKNNPFNLSDLKSTIEGFARRYRDIFIENKVKKSPQSVKFVVLTNRPLSSTFKSTIKTIAQGSSETTRAINTFKQYAELDDNHLQQFCSMIELCDGEGDYLAQRHLLQAELANLVAGSVTNAQIREIAAIVGEAVLPNNEKEIRKEHVLQVFGINDERELFPAPAEFDRPKKTFIREQQDEILRKILTTKVPLIISADGGVGKSVITQQLAESLPVGSKSITFDCFAAGSYKSLSKSRHRHIQGLVQIVNELAEDGLCSYIIPNQHDRDDVLMRSFLAKLQHAVDKVKTRNKDAVLAIFIDAADNAEMAAHDRGDNCFVSDLLAEQVPDGCRIIALCRPERVHKLKPKSYVEEIELNPFSEAETARHFRQYFSKATDNHCLELHRLTSGNGRVQANALDDTVDGGNSDVVATLKRLGPNTISVDDLIEAQLVAAIGRIKDHLSESECASIDTICKALAILPPFIPLAVLAAVANVAESTIKSFIADLGRPLWLTDNAVQFRDEPTETWFTDNFVPTDKEIEVFTEKIKPFAADFEYVAENLPLLLHRSQSYDELIELALSDDFLPINNIVSSRRIRMFRLQFAFKAALKLKDYVAACKLALRTAEEVESDERQEQLFQENIDLVAVFLSAEKAQELAYRRAFNSHWYGSFSVYSASILSNINESKGEARNYLRSAHSWLQIYYSSKNTDTAHHFERLEVSDQEKLEFGFAHLNLNGPKGFIKYLNCWKNIRNCFSIGRDVVKRLIDHNRFDEIHRIAALAPENRHLIVVICHELFVVGRYLSPEVMSKALNGFIAGDLKVPTTYSNYDIEHTIPAILSFAECCISLKLPNEKIQTYVEKFALIPFDEHMGSSHRSDEYNNAIRSQLILNRLAGGETLTIDSIVADTFKNGKSRGMSEFKRKIGDMLPWFHIRLQVLYGDKLDLEKAFKSAQQQIGRFNYGQFNYFDVTDVKFQILVLAKNYPAPNILACIRNLQGQLNNWHLLKQIRALRAVYRLSHLNDLKLKLEDNCYEMVINSSEIKSNESADCLVELARAVMSESIADATAYFNDGVAALSESGEHEITHRWAALVSLAKQVGKGNQSHANLAYRFMRCAEMVGDTINDEKHWDRPKAINLSCGICPSTATAAVSRWRDREVDFVESYLPALAEGLLNIDQLSPAAVFALTGFSWSQGRGNFVKRCIELAPSHKQQTLLDIAIKQFGLREASVRSFQKLALVAEEQGLNAGKVGGIVEYLEDIQKQREAQRKRGSDDEQTNDEDGIDWDEFFTGVELATTEGLESLFTSYKKIPYRFGKPFWDEYYSRLRDCEVADFFNVLVNADFVDINDICVALEMLPAQLKSRPSIRHLKASLIDNIGHNHAFSLIKRYKRENLFRSDFINVDDFELLRTAILRRLVNDNKPYHSETLWELVQFLSSLISYDDVVVLLDYGVHRFEQYIEPDYADGTWNKWLETPSEPLDALTGYILSSLGAPSAKMRWQALHSVRVLFQTKEQQAINSLIGWLQKNDLGPFGAKAFPFYQLHARQYLLIGLARGAKEAPELLLAHAELFAKFALETEHILIQIYAAKIAIEIERVAANTYSSAVKEQLLNVGKSQIPSRKLEQYYQVFQTPWQQNSQQNTEISDKANFPFEVDFTESWLGQLAEVFAVDCAHIENLVSDVITNELIVGLTEDVFDEPRQYLRSFNSYYGEPSTYYENAAYPKVDDYNFYLSYHGMMIVAARLLAIMPVVADQYEESHERWNKWLKSHSLTRDDGFWVADNLDPPPLQREPWVYEPISDTWEWQIKANDFVDALMIEGEQGPELRVWANWQEVHESRIQIYDISSALIPEQTATALLRAFQLCSNPQFIGIPAANDDSTQSSEPDFNMTGWIINQKCELQLDAFDATTDGIKYPPIKIDEQVCQALNLSMDCKQRNWITDVCSQTYFKSELWTVPKDDDRDRYSRYGRRLNGSLKALQKLCEVNSCEIIFKVKLKRKQNRGSREQHADDYPYSHKIFILDKNGRLRDYRQSYQIRAVADQ